MLSILKVGFVKTTHKVNVEVQNERDGAAEL